MISAYSELYLNDAKRCLGDCFDYAISLCGINIEEFVNAFLRSGYAEMFEIGNPSVVSGMSGIELAQRVIEHINPDFEFPKQCISEGCTDIYWAGWILAEYQWDTCRRFKDIMERVSLFRILEMYMVYHEMDTVAAIEEIDRRYKENVPETHLKTIRENRGISQAQLAELSGVSLRSIQMYEQRGNSIDRAQAGSLFKLSRVLGCKIDDLLESPED